jgi:hypothetical protein
MLGWIRASQRGQGANVARQWPGPELQIHCSFATPLSTNHQSSRCRSTHRHGLRTVSASNPHPRNTFALFSTRNRHPHVAALHRCMSTTHANMSTPRGGRGGRGPRGGASNYTRGFGQARSNGDVPKPTPDRPAQGVYTRGGRARGGKWEGAARGHTTTPGGGAGTRANTGARGSQA